MKKEKREIPGTIIFDGPASTAGYPLNKMCYSFNNLKDRNCFLADEHAYCRRFGLSEEQERCIRERDILGLLRAGGSIYYLAKFAGILGLDVQDVGALQTGKSVEEFKAMLVKAGE